MSLRVRDKQARVDRLAYEAAEKTAADKIEAERRTLRKKQLRAELEKLAIYNENTSHLPAQHKRSQPPEIALQESDYELLKELNEEFLRELNPMTPAQVEAENERA